MDQAATSTSMAFIIRYFGEIIPLANRLLLVFYKMVYEISG